jgi:predicted AAA+ superfamily ATPase
MTPILTVTIKGTRGSGKTTALLLLKAALAENRPAIRQVFCGPIVFHASTGEETMEVFLERRKE